jgi:hypothetical protein
VQIVVANVWAATLLPVVKMKRDIGIRLALSGLGTALAIIFITLAYYVNKASVSLNVAASIGIMLPLAKYYYKEALLSSIAASVIGFFIVNINIIPFIIVCSFYVVFTILWHNKKFNKILGYVIKIIYSIFVFYILYSVVNLIGIDFSILPQLSTLPNYAIYLILNFLFSLAFIMLDVLFIQVYLYLQKQVNKAIKSK